MRETELWDRMTVHLGPGYVRVWAEQQCLRGLDGRTVVEALSGGVPCKQIWRAVWAALELPEHFR